MFRRYSVKYFGDVVSLQLRGDVASRRYQWVGALDGLLLSGRLHYVVGLQDVLLPRDADSGFILAVAQRITSVGGAVVFVAPTDPHAQRVLRRTGLSRALTFVADVDSGVSTLEDEAVAAAPETPRRSISRWLRRPPTFQE